MTSVESNKFTQPLADGSDIVIEKDEIDELLKDNLEEIVEDSNLITEPRKDESETNQLLDSIQKMSAEEKNQLINLLSQKNLNPEKLNFSGMSKESFNKMKLKEKIAQKRMGRMPKAARTSQLAKSMTKNKASNSTTPNEENPNADDRDLDDLVAMIEGNDTKKKEKKNK